MNYKMKLTKGVYALIGLVILVTIASIIMNILILARVGKLFTNNNAITIVSLVSSVLLLGICILLLANTKYALKDDYLVVYFGFMTIKFPYNIIVATAYERISKRLYFQYNAKEKKDGFGVMAVNISEQQIDNFLTELIKHNPKIKSLNSDDNNKNC